MHCKILGLPVQEGTGRLGCNMGPDGYRAAGIADAIRELGHEFTDLGNLAPAEQRPLSHPNPVIKALPQAVAWIEAISEAAYRESEDGFPIFLGGDHLLAAGTVPGIARRAAEKSRKQFVLWLDAHTDFHTLETTGSGNLHGTPVAYYTGQKGFEGYFPALAAPIDPANVCMMGIRSVDPAERDAIQKTAVSVFDMRLIDEHGVAALLRRFLQRVKDENGLLHVSLDVDFLEPSIAPAVGTTVPGGATFREAHLIMEMLHDSDLVTSLDLVELNPFLDERGRTATVMVDLMASLLGRSVMDRPTINY
ncbi:arginase [Brucella sp. NBRC 12952]|uniref:Arginase n=1 Tax=Brucella pseudogrignonensis TaxID=419475 RepID=A0A256GRJ0_9HYPH|nr:arginase [Brucella pseudogrignonensis]EMG53902.1 arginase [Ochrobactrum sp. CDB2]NNV22693.1 arginase [Brucella pseudogrignonensis]OYR29406.1 arginase [Brucella pseudogrignonensis]